MYLQMREAASLPAAERELSSSLGCDSRGKVGGCLFAVKDPAAGLRGCCESEEDLLHGARLRHLAGAEQDLYAHQASATCILEHGGHFPGYTSSSLLPNFSPPFTGLSGLLLSSLALVLSLVFVRSLKLGGDRS